MIWAMANPQGRVMLSAAKIDEQLALIEARVFLNKTDTAPAYTSAVQRMMNEVPGGLYVQAAQNAAIEQVLDEAGFTVHFNGIPVPSSVAAVKENTVREAPVQKKASAKKTVSQKHEPLAVPVVQDKPVQKNPAAVEKAAAEKQIAEPIAKPVIEANAVEESKVEAPTEIIIEKSAVKETVSTPVLETIPMPTVEETAEPASTENTVLYTTSTPVEEICKLMSVKEAFDYVITTGSCKGITMGQAIARRPASVRFYTTPGYKGDDIIAINRGSEDKADLIVDTSAVGTQYYCCMVTSASGGSTYTLQMFLIFGQNL